MFKFNICYVYEYSSKNIPYPSIPQNLHLNFTFSLKLSRYLISILSVNDPKTGCYRHPGGIDGIFSDLICPLKGGI